MVPIRSKLEGVYGVKVGMDTRLINNTLTTVTYVQPLKMIKKEDRYELNFEEIPKRYRRDPILRQLNTDKEPEQILKLVNESSYVDVTALSKGKMTLGPIQRRNVAMQSRKARGVFRHVGSMGCRRQAKVEWTKPFSGRVSGQRTVLNLKNHQLSTLTKTIFNRYSGLQIQAFTIQGCVPGGIGGVVFLKASHRKQK
jgi:ribosomal protein L3